MAGLLLLAGCGGSNSGASDGDQPQEGVLADQEGTINDAMAIDSAAGAETDMIMDVPNEAPVAETGKKESKPAERAEATADESAPETTGNTSAE